MADLAVAVADQAVEQLGQPDGIAGAAAAFQRLQQGGVQAGDAGQVVACPAQDQVADGGEARVARVGQDRHQQADELPPVAQRRPGQVLEAFGQFRGVMARLGVGGDGAGASSLRAASQR